MSFKYRFRTKDESSKHNRKFSGDLVLDVGTELKPFMQTENNVIRILPPAMANDENWWALTTYIHYNVGPDRGQYLCTFRMKTQRCAVCDYRDKLLSEGMTEKELRENHGNLFPTHRKLVYIVDRKNDSDIVKIFYMPFRRVYQPINEISVDRQGNYRPIDHPEKGNDIRYTKHGSGFNTDYGPPQLEPESYLHESESITDDLLDFVDQYPLIPDNLVYHPYEYVNGMLGISSELENAEREETPSRRNGESRRGKYDRETNDENALRKAGMLDESDSRDRKKRKDLADKLSDYSVDDLFDWSLDNTTYNDRNLNKLFDEGEKGDREWYEMCVVISNNYFDNRNG